MRRKTVQWGGALASRVSRLVRGSANRQALAIFVSLVTVLSPLSGGISTALAANAQQQARTPQPLSSVDTHIKPAADVALTGTAAKNSSEIQSVLDRQSSVSKKNKPQDLTHVKTLDEDRAATKRTFLNADGSRTLELSAQAKSFKDEGGKWQDVDTSLAQDGKTGKWHSKANAWSATFSSLSETTGVELSKGGQTVVMHPIGGKSVVPTVTGSAPKQIVTYKDVWPGVNLVYQVIGSELKESIWIASAEASRDFQFDVSGTALAADKEHPGYYALDGQLADFRLAAPTVATSNEGVIGADPYVVQSVDGTTVTVKVNPDWLAKQPAKAFPVVVDPTYANFTNGESNYINFKSDTFVCNAGQGCSNSTGNTGSAIWRFAALMNYSGLNNSAYHFDSASLNLLMATNPPVANPGTSAGKNIWVRHANSLNYNGGTGDYGVVQSPQPIGSSGSIDITSIYQAAIANGDWGAYLMINGEENNGYSYKMFDYSADSVTFNYHYNQSGPTAAGLISPDDNTTLVNTHPSLVSGTATDIDNDPVYYRFRVATGQDGLTGTVATSGWLSSTSWSVPDGVLQDGMTYRWRVQTWDGIGNDDPTLPADGNNGNLRTFKIDLRTGKGATQSFDTVGPVGVNLAMGNVVASNASNSISTLGGSIGVGMDFNSPVRSQQGLVGQYWNYTQPINSIPSGTIPNYTTTDSNINFNWGGGSPAPQLVASDYFVARWSGYFVAPVGGSYQFGANADDGVRISVNGTLVLDHWSGSAGSPIYGTAVTLTAGQVVPIQIDYMEIAGSAAIQLLVQGAVSNQVVPATWLQTGIKPVSENNGLIGQYYFDDGSHNLDTVSASKLFLQRIDPTVSFQWQSGSPVPGGPVDNFMARWTGFFTAPATDTYTFGSWSDDGFRIYIDNNKVATTWAGDTSPPMSAGISLTQGQKVAVKIDYQEGVGLAHIDFRASGGGIGTVSQPQTVPSRYLSPNNQVLPAGWKLSVDPDGNLAYDFARIGMSDVVLTDSTGSTHTYSWTGTKYKPAPNEYGNLVRNADGTLTLQDEDGKTYVFNSDGTLKSVTSTVDDRKPSALQYIYGDTPSHLKYIYDGVRWNGATSNRFAHVLYSGTDTCPTVPSGFTSPAPSGLVCAVQTSDGNQTNFFYVVDGTSGIPHLARVLKPGNEETDYSYDSNGLLTLIRDSLANDAVIAGIRTQDNSILTIIGYDAIGRATSVTMPAPNTGDTQRAHVYDYQIAPAAMQPNLGYTKVHETGEIEPNGYVRQMVYDSLLRTAQNYDVAGLVTSTQWNATKDLVNATVDPTGNESANLYDFDDRVTDSFGPAPQGWFGSDFKPTSSYLSQVPHTQTGFDEGIGGLAATYYDLQPSSDAQGTTSQNLNGSPLAHGTGIGSVSNVSLGWTWGTGSPVTNVPKSGTTDGWGVRLTGYLNMNLSGNYSFKAFSNDGVRLSINNQSVVDDWTDGAARWRNGSTTVVGNLSNPWIPIEVSYYNKPGDTAQLQINVTSPGGSDIAIPYSALSPSYSLATSHKTFDSNSSVGDVTATTNFGSNPELGLPQSNTLDAAGLNYTNSSTYEAQGASGSYLRQLSTTLPGGATTTIAYYGATDTMDNPCTTGVTEAYKQGGMAHTITDPTGRITESIHDDVGRVVATRYNSDSWTCTTYDARGRITLTAIPSINGQSARTMTNNWSVNGSPFVTSTSDSEGTITTTIDLAGRTVSYSDAFSDVTTYTYDSVGRLASRSGPIGTEGFTYNSYDRLSSQSLDGVTLASPVYDSYGRLGSVTYPTAGSLALALTRDTQGRTTGYTYTLGNGTTTVSDAVTLSQSGQITGGTENGAIKSYGYDKADRLISAAVGGDSYTYGFGTPSTCTGSYNSNAGKDSNRTSMTHTVGGTTATSTYCYNSGDQLTSSSEPLIGTPVYDAHGNTTSLSSGSTQTSFGYDSSDRNSSIVENSGATEVFQSRDAQGRVTYRQEDNYGNNAKQTWYGFTGIGDNPDFVRQSDWTIIEKYEQLPGGVLLTIRPTQTGNAQKAFSLPNLHGDVMLTADASGAQAAAFRYDPFGNLISTSGLPNNAPSSIDYGWVGQHQRAQEADFATKPIQMGARVYIPLMGRFLSIDPVKGGTENDYLYPADPVNGSDIDGTFNWKATISIVTTVASVASILPGPIGMVASGVAAAGYAVQGDYKSAAIYGAGIALAAVGAGAGVVALKMASRTEAAVNVGTTAVKAAEYSVYVGKDAEGATRYVGITSRNPILRFAEHLRSTTPRASLRYEVAKTGISKQAARGMEQAVIDRYGLSKNGGQLYNKINSIRRIR